MYRKLRLNWFLSSVLIGWTVLHTWSGASSFVIGSESCPEQLNFPPVSIEELIVDWSPKPLTLARIHRRDAVEPIRRGMKGEGKSRQGFDTDGWGRVLSVSAARRGYLKGSSPGDGRDQGADCSRRHCGASLARVGAAVG